MMRRFILFHLPIYQHLYLFVYIIPQSLLAFCKECNYQVSDRVKYFSVHGPISKRL